MTIWINGGTPQTSQEAPTRPKKGGKKGNKKEEEQES